MELVEFLNARYSEEAAPQALPAWHEPFCREPSVDPKSRMCLYCGEQEDLAKLEHVARPSKVLADIDAKQRVVDLMARTLDAAEGDCEVDHYGGLGAVEEALLILALPYADHPDYDEAWRP